MAVTVGRRLDLGVPNHLVCVRGKLITRTVEGFGGGGCTRRNGDAGPPHARPFECLRVSGPSGPGRGWIPALGGRNDPPKADRLPSGGLEAGCLTALAWPT